MNLPSDFQFTQTNLQDYVDCPRRFELRYLQRVVWPAPQAEPLIDHEEHMAQGAQFHRLVQRHISGIAAEKLAPYAQGEPLERWWANYLRAGLRDVPPQRRPEITLTAPLGAYRLIAKYDLIAVEPGGRAVIVDWKTSPRKPRPAVLRSRMQTVVYRYLLALAGAHLNDGQPIAPEQIEMVYWFAEHPDAPERFPYDADQFREDEQRLIALVDEIARREVFDLTSDVTHCRFCPYRSLCRRGAEAGDFREVDLDEDTPQPDTDFVFDLDQIAEIEF